MEQLLKALLDLQLQWDRHLLSLQWPKRHRKFGAHAYVTPGYMSAPMTPSFAPSMAGQASPSMGAPVQQRPFRVRVQSGSGTQVRAVSPNPVPRGQQMPTGVLSARASAGRQCPQRGKGDSTESNIDFTMTPKNDRRKATAPLLVCGMKPSVFGASFIDHTHVPLKTNMEVS